MMAASLRIVGLCPPLILYEYPRPRMDGRRVERLRQAVHHGSILDSGTPLFRGPLLGVQTGAGEKRLQLAPANHTCGTQCSYIDRGGEHGDLG